jgi:outer membrane protein assembly factor BamB
VKTRILACVLVALVAGCAGGTPTLADHPAPITFAWSYRAGDYVRGVPAVSGQVVYVGADDNAMHAVDASTGNALWSYETADNVTSSLAVQGDTIFFGSWDGTVYALSAGDG